MSKIIGYVRTNNMYKDGSEQQNSIIRYAKSKGLDTDIYIDDSTSGLSEGELLIPAIKSASRGDIFVVTDPSRISRNMNTFHKAIGALECKQVEVVFLSDETVIN